MARRRTLAVASAMLLFFVVAIFGVLARRRAATKQAATAWARLSRCLLGDGPLGKDEAPSSRIRRIELGVLERRMSKIVDAHDEGWPQRCSVYGRELDAWVGTTGIDEHGSLEDSLARGSADIFDDVYTTAQRLLPDARADARDVPLPPEAARTVTLSPKPDLNLHMFWRVPLGEGAPVIDGSIRTLATENDDMDLVFYDIAGGDDPERTLLQARRLDLPFKRRAHVSLVGVEDGAAPLLAMDGSGNSGVFSIGGARLVASKTAFENGAWGRANGFVATLERAEVKNEKGETVWTYTLVRRAPDGTVTRTLLDLPRYVDDGSDWRAAAVVGDWIVWLDGRYGVEHPLRARRILEDEPAVGPVIDIGVVPAPYLLGRFACRTKEALFVDLVDKEGHRILAGDVGDRWHAPLGIPGTPVDWSCSGSRATFVDIEPVRAGDAKGSFTKGPAHVTRVDCADACTSASVTLDEVIVDSSSSKSGAIVAAPLEGDLTVLVALEQGVVTLRMAPLAELPRARVRVILDAADPTQLAVYARHGVAALVFDGYRGSGGFRLDASGALAPIEWVE